MTTVVKPVGPGREEFSDRLLKGSVKKSYAPVVDIDWDAPLDPDKFYLPPRLVSLYGTPMWDQMTRAQRVELSRQELVNTLSAGIWFENILNQALLRKLMHTDPTSRATPTMGTTYRNEGATVDTMATTTPRPTTRPAIHGTRVDGKGGSEDRRPIMASTHGAAA